MSYTIIIGEATVRKPGIEKYDPTPSLGIWAVEMKHPDAPVFPGDDMTANTNERSPAYSAWSDFSKKTGLESMFFGKEHGLMREHSGEFALTKAHHKQVAEALAEWRNAHKDAEPGWCECEKCSWNRDSKAVHVERDSTLARLIWLEWWMRWALENCKIPAFCNL